jgi:hypothetical protein
MKFLVIAASALAFAATPALAGGWGGSNYGGSPQFANSSATNYALQVGSMKSLIGFGGIEQVAGAGAESVNLSRCGCKGKQVAKANSKNTSFQAAYIHSGLSVGHISQSAVATSTAKNIRGGGRY